MKSILHTPNTKLDDEKTHSLAQCIVEEFLVELKAIHSTGAAVPETSYYPSLSNLFNAVGRTLKPKVRCIFHTKNQGAGIPDAGLFTSDQFQHPSDLTPKTGKPPARGVIEVKGTKPDIKTIAVTKQVKDYLNTYGIVIVSNLRGFLILERGPDWQPLELESFALAGDEQDFWQRIVAHPRAGAQLLGDQFIEFLKRACLHAAPLVNPKDLAWFLASYARDALFRVEYQKQLPALQNVRSALEDALGMKFSGEKGEHFFRSTLVQTLFYGVFSAWVSWHRSNSRSDSRFNWRAAEWSLRVPFIRVLYEEVAKPSRLGPLELVEVLDWTASVLNRVNRNEFFKRFQEESAVQYFYEPFLEAYDPDLRKALGVWFTPTEIVKYQVARVDRVLREELDLPEGLADPHVIVLDPCCGTGAYLLEVLNTIATTLRDKGGDALVAADLKHAAIHRIFGFEIMPAPFVVSHLQLSLMLQRQGAPLSQQSGERVGVYLTNALTGWKPPQGPKQKIMAFAELEGERDAAEQVKRDKRILVVLGNPPYNAFSGVSPEEEQGLVEPYKESLNKPKYEGGWGIKKFNLDDLYVRFFRIAERRIAEMSGMGVVSFISNFSYLGDPSFVVMRRRFLSEFDMLWLDCMNGDSRETGKLTPDDKPDPSVFSTEYNREGIRVGTAVCVIVRKPGRQKKPMVRFRHFWGVNKRADLIKSLKVKNFNATYMPANPNRENRFSFRPENVAAAYDKWPSVVMLCYSEPISGLQEMRKGALMDTSRDELVRKMRVYFDKAIDWQTFYATGGGLAINGGRFDAKECRASLISSFDEENIRRYALYPFDVRWCYHTNVRPLWNEPRPDLAAQWWPGNRFLITRPYAERPYEWAAITATSVLPDYHLLRPNVTAIPIRLRDGAKGFKASQNGLFDNNQPFANLSQHARGYLIGLGVKNPDADAETAGLVWMHALAVGYSPAYLIENADGIRRDWPRIPLPATREMLEASAELGEEIAALLDTEAEVPGVTTGKIRPLLKSLGRISKIGGGALDPSGDDLAVTASWGHKGKDGVTMPGKGKCERRPYQAGEREAAEAEAAACGISRGEIANLLGDETCDLYLNHTAYWSNVPLNVWEYYIGGYQVIKKWLSYREHSIIGRSIKPEEAREVTNMARRIAAIILLQPKLDENYRRIMKAAFDWTVASS